MKISAEKLKTFAAQVMNKAGLTEEEAETFADVLIHADCRGVGSHGISRLGVYSKRISSGVIHSGVHLKVLSETASTYHFDAQAGPGAPMGMEMLNKCMEKAKESGCCFASALGGTHWGALSYYTKIAAKNGFIAIVSCNADKGVVAYGGAQPMLGTNPLSIALPAKKHNPVCLDMATSMAARGKIVLASKEGKEIPDTWALGTDGKPTTDPDDALEASLLLPFGGYKGFGISLIIDMFCACLGGAGDSRHLNSFWHDFKNSQNLGYNMMLIDVEKFAPLEAFCERMDNMIDEIKASKTAEGVSEILMPGEIEDRKEAAALKDGVEISEKLLNELILVGENYGVKFSI